MTNRVAMMVMLNGLTVEEKIHERIFDVFQANSAWLCF